MTKLSTKALRLYDSKGLLEPAIRDPINNYRYYTLDQLEDAIRIKLLNTMGFGISEMKDILDAVAEENKDYLSNVFNKRQKEIQLEITRLQKIQDIIQSNNPTELMYLQCSDPEIKITPKFRVISKREYGNYSRDVPRIIGELMGVLSDPDNTKNQVRITGPIMLLVHDSEYKEEGADIEMAIPISGRIQLNGDDMEVKNIVETTVVSVIYTGPYADVSIGYTRAYEYAIRQGYQVLQGNSREIYLNSPQDVPDDQLMTELQLIVEKVNGEDDE